MPGPLFERALSEMRPHLTAVLSVSWDGRIVFAESPDCLERLGRWRSAGDGSVGEDAVLVDISRGSSAASFFEGKEPGGMRRVFEDAALRVFVSEDGSVAPSVGLQGTGAGWGRPTVVYSTQAMAVEVREAVQEQASLRLGVGEVFEPLEILEALKVEYGVRRLVCVGGGALFAILLRAGCLDEIWLTFRPQIFGNKTGETLSGKKGESLSGKKGESPSKKTGQSPSGTGGEGQRGLPDGFFSASVEASLLEMEQVGGECFTRWKLGAKPGGKHKKAPGQPKFGREFFRKG